MLQNSSPSHCKDCHAFKKSVFHGLSEKNLNFLAQEKVSFSNMRGESFNSQGAEANQVYCISEGSAKVTRSSEQPHAESIVRLATTGDLLGYRCIFSEESYRATGVALEETKACKINKSFIFQMIESDSGFSREILKRMGQEISSSENHHHSFCKKNVRERIAESLLILYKKASTKVEGGYRLDIQLTRQELASWVGTAKETVIRCLTDFKEENLIEQREDCLIILNLEKLATVSGNSSFNQN